MSRPKSDPLDVQLWRQMESEGVPRGVVARVCGVHANTILNHLGPYRGTGTGVRPDVRLKLTRDTLRASAERRRRRKA